MTARARARLLLLATVFIWGTSFVVVKGALADCSPLLFNLVRMSIASAVLAFVNRRALAGITRKQILSGALAGLFLGTAYQFQTLGLTRTTAAKSAFITGLVVVLVPLLQMVPGLRLPGHRRSEVLAGAGAVLAFSGLVLLTTPAGTALRDFAGAVSAGDVLTMMGALAFALHLLTLARVSPGMPAGMLATGQVTAAAALMLVTYPLEAMHRVLWTPRLLIALLITSLLATAAAFTIQSYAQKHLLPTETAVLLTLEPLFASLTSLLLLGEYLTHRAMAGAALILISIAVVELAPGLMHSQEIPS